MVARASACNGSLQHRQHQQAAELQKLQSGCMMRILRYDVVCAERAWSLQPLLSQTREPLIAGAVDLASISSSWSHTKHVRKGPEVCTATAAQDCATYRPRHSQVPRLLRSIYCTLRLSINLHLTYAKTKKKKNHGHPWIWLYVHCATQAGLVIAPFLRSSI